MGSVYVAERADGEVKKRVAVKLPRPRICVALGEPQLQLRTNSAPFFLSNAPRQAPAILPPPIAVSLQQAPPAQPEGTIV
jgi:hypothetical protein